MDQVQRVPFLDLHSQIGPIRQEIIHAIEGAIDASDFVLGPRLEAFESAFADYCGVEHAIGVSSGTDALFLILKALGIGPGDEVITVPNVFIADIEAITYTGATPVLVDVDERSFNMDPAAVEQAITDKTKAIIPVHLFGQPAAMDELLNMARRRSIYVIEDACQAHGARYKGKRVGALGTAAAFSFYPTKNLGGMGDGGAITTNDAFLAGTMRRLRHHAQAAKNEHQEVGYNCRLDSIQAAVLNVKLPHLDGLNAKRREIADRYRSKLAGTGMTFQAEAEGTESVYHIFAVRHQRRQVVLEQLQQGGIGYGGHIAEPAHLQPGYAHLGYGKGAFPVSEKLSEELVSIPVCPSLSMEQVDLVIDVLSRDAISV